MMTPRHFSAFLLLGALGTSYALLSPAQDDVQITPETETLPHRPGVAPCPDGAEAEGLGPEMVPLPEGFCIDTTEVSRGQYAAWLDTAPATDTQGASCTDNEDFTPTCSWPPSGKENQPVVCVDWCDAKAFCEAAGKRLCGAVGTGAAYPIDEYADAATSEWQAACSSGGKNDYTYGNEEDTQVCRGGDAEDYTTWGTGDVGSFSGCHSSDAGYEEVFDLSGNVAEWDNSCEGDAEADGCRIRGGSYQHQGRGLRCTMAKGLRWPRTRTASSVGFRCCADE